MSVLFVVMKFQNLHKILHKSGVTSSKNLSFHRLAVRTSAKVMYEFGVPPLSRQGESFFFALARRMHIPKCREGFLVLLLLVSPSPFSALYVHVSQGRMKCFIEYWDEHTVVLVTYRSPDQAPLPREQEVGLYIYVPPSVPLMRFCSDMYNTRHFGTMWACR